MINITEISISSKLFPSCQNGNNFHDIRADLKNQNNCKTLDSGYFFILPHLQYK